jgi:Fur family ferric uptake transcriptional regulator
MTNAQRNTETQISALQRAGLRVTAQRIALLQVLAESDDHPDVEELHLRARETDPKISIATVYRTVAALEEARMVIRHSFEGASARFERVGKLHHDHIIDLDSGEIVEFQSDLIEKLQEEIAARLGYDLIHHRLELYCRKRG